MEQIRVETTASPEIIFKEVDGNLRLRGWDREEVRADASQEHAMKIDKSGNKVIIAATAGMIVRIPNASSVNIGAVHGETLLQSIEGDIEIDVIDGPLTLKNVGHTIAETVLGPLVAKQLEGNLTVQDIQGPATIRDVEGEINLSKIDGPFNFRGLSMGIDATCEGAAILRLETDPGGNYKVTADSSIRCKLEPGTSANIKLHSDANFIRIKAPDTSLKLDETDYEFTLGDGECEIELNANGPIELKAYSDVDEFGDEFEAAFEEEVTQMAEDISVQVSEQIEAQMENLHEQLASLTVNLGPLIHDKRKRAKVERKMEHTVHKVQRKAENAARRAERQTRAAMARARRERYRRHMRGDDPVSDSERQMVLQMLSEKKISVEDAETLMSALEGNASSKGIVPPVPPLPPVPSLSTIEEELDKAAEILDEELEAMDEILDEELEILDEELEKMDEILDEELEELEEEFAELEEDDDE